MPKLAPRLLSKSDLKNLRDSGLKDSTIRANRLRTEDGALLFQYRRLDGTWDEFGRRRPHKPRRDKEGRVVKYEQPPGVPPRAYFPSGSLKKLRDGKSPIYITEGEKKAMALSQLGIAAVGLGGVWCWKWNGSEELIEDLKAIEWNGRAVYVCFDYDPKPKTRRHVQLAAQRLAQALRATGVKEVYAVEMPPGPHGAKMGVDDFLVAHGEEAFHERVEAAQPIPLGSRPLRGACGSNRRGQRHAVDRPIRQRSPVDWSVGEVDHVGWEAVEHQRASG